MPPLPDLQVYNISMHTHVCYLELVFGYVEGRQRSFFFYIFYSVTILQPRKEMERRTKPVFSLFLFFSPLLCFFFMIYRTEACLWGAFRVSGSFDQMPNQLVKKVYLQKSTICERKTGRLEEKARLDVRSNICFFLKRRNSRAGSACKMCMFFFVFVSIFPIV